MMKRDFRNMLRELTKMTKRKPLEKNFESRILQWPSMLIHIRLGKLTYKMLICILRRKGRWGRMIPILKT